MRTTRFDRTTPPRSPNYRSRSPPRSRTRRRNSIVNKQSDYSSHSFYKGDKVEAKCDGWTKYFEGRITQVNRDDTYDIKFDDGERKRGVLKNKIRLIRRKTKTNRRNRREYSSESNEDLDSEMRIILCFQMVKKFMF